MQIVDNKKLRLHNYCLTQFRSHFLESQHSWLVTVETNMKCAERAKATKGYIGPVTKKKIKLVEYKVELLYIRGYLIKYF